MKIISTSNIINNPPPISNYPLREIFADIKANYGKSQADLCKQTLAQEKRADNFMTCLLLASLATVFLIGRGAYKGAKKRILNAVNFTKQKFNIAKTYLQQKFSTIITKFKK